MKRRWGPRDRLAVIIAAVYLVVSALLALGIPPIQPLIDNGERQSQLLAEVFEQLQLVPYIERVRDYMEASGATPTDVSAKTTFLLRTYFVLLGGYAGAMILYVIALIVFGFADDPLTSVFSVFAGRSSLIILVFLAVFVAFDALVAWIGVDGTSAFWHEKRYVRAFDFTPQHDFFILENIALMALSLFMTLQVVRIVSSFLYASLGGRVSSAK